jgi:hypothetical protein
MVLTLTHPGTGLPHVFAVDLAERAALAECRHPWRWQLGTWRGCADCCQDARHALAALDRDDRL